MSIILGSGDALKDLHIGNKKISKVVVGNKVVWQKQKWPGFRMVSNDGLEKTIYFTWKDDEDLIDMHYSFDNGKTWQKFEPGTNLTFSKEVCFWNKKNYIQGGSRFYFMIDGGYGQDKQISLFGDFTSLTNFDITNPDTFYNNILSYFNGISSVDIQIPTYNIPLSNNYDHFIYYPDFYNKHTTLTILGNGHITNEIINKLVYGYNNFTNDHIIYFNGTYDSIPQGWTIQQFSQNGGKNL